MLHKVPVLNHKVCGLLSATVARASPFAVRSGFWNLPILAKSFMIVPPETALDPSYATFGAEKSLLHGFDTVVIGSVSANGSANIFGRSP